MQAFIECAHFARSASPCSLVFTLVFRYIYLKLISNAIFSKRFPLIYSLPTLAGLISYFADLPEHWTSHFILCIHS